MRTWLRKRRFWRTLQAADERELNASELIFLNACRQDDPVVAAEEEAQQVCLAALRACVIEPDDDPTFDRRLMRRYRIERMKARAEYWSPAVVGAAVAAIAVLAFLQVLTGPSNLRTIDTSRSEVHNTRPERVFFPEFRPSLRDDR